MSAEPTTDLLKEAASLRGAKRWREAIDLYVEYLKDHPDDADAICWHAYSLWHSGDLKGAIPHYKKASELEPKWSGIHNCLGSINRRLKNYDESVKEFRTALKISPRYADAHANLADLLWTQGKLADATEHYRSAIEAKPDWGKMYDEYARVLIERGMLAQANMAVREAIRLEPHNTVFQSTLSTVLSRLDRHAEAEAVLRKLIDVAPDDGALYSRLAWVLSRYETKPDHEEQAAQAARDAVWRSPKLPYPHYLLGWLAQKAGDNESAIAHFKRYLELDPKDVEGAALGLSTLGAAPAPDRAPPSYVKRIYAKRAPYWDGNIDSKTRYRAPILIADALEHYMGKREGLDIMDVGCGTGSGGPYIRERARRLDGLDMSSHMLEKAREKGCYDELIEGDLETILNSRPEQYDVLTSAATLIHFGDLGPPLKACAVALRPGGWMAFTVFPSTGEGISVLPFYCHGHSPEHITQRAQEAGFDVIQIKEEIHEYHEGERPVTGLVGVLRKRDQGAAA